MQHDEPSFPSQPSAAIGPVASMRAIPGWKQPWVRHAALGALVLATSLALACYASAWLVPPYLALMAWLLGPSIDRRARATAAGASRAAASFGAVGPDAGQVEHSSASWDDATSSDVFLETSAAAEADSALATAGLKTKRGRTRGRRARPAPAVEPTAEVTWIRVGPGKFVRVEGTNATATDDAPPAEAGPAVPPNAEPLPAPGEALPPDATVAGDVTEGAPDEATDAHRQPPLECTDEVSEPPEAADVLSASCADDPQTPAQPVEAIADVGTEPEPEVDVDPVDAPAEEEDSHPDAANPDQPHAVLGEPAYDSLEDEPSTTPRDSSIPDGPPTGSAGRALWVALREACPRLIRPLRSVAGRAPTRRALRSGRPGRVNRVVRPHARRRHVRLVWRALHARSPPRVGPLPQSGSRANPARTGRSADRRGVCVILAV